MYSCSTAKPGTWAKVLVIAMFAAGAGLFLTGYLVQSYRGAFQCAGAVAAVAAVLLSTRLMTSYVYEIAEGEMQGLPDLVITEVRGRRSRTVCRVSLANGVFVMPDERERLPSDAGKGGPSCNCVPFPQSRGCGVCIFLPSETEGAGVIRFAPDGEMISICLRYAKKFEGV